MGIMALALIAPEATKRSCRADFPELSVLQTGNFKRPLVRRFCIGFRSSSKLEVTSKPVHSRLAPSGTSSDVDLHDFVERHVVATTVVELRGAHGRMRGHDLRVFQSAAV